MIMILYDNVHNVIILSLPPSLSLSLSLTHSLPSLSSEQLTSSSLHFGEEETQHLLHLLETYSGAFVPTKLPVSIFIYDCWLCNVNNLIVK